MAEEPTNGSGNAASQAIASDPELRALTSDLRLLTSDIMLGRAQWMRQVGLGFDGARDYYEIFGYDRVLTARLFRETYSRGGLAKRVVEAYPKATWRGGVEVYEDEDPDVKTEFEQAFDDLNARLNVWSVFERADILAGLSTYSVIMLGAPGAFDSPLPKAKGADSLVYLSPYWGGGGPSSSMSYGTTMADVDATIESYETDARSPRFGEPLFYSVKRTNVSLPNEANKVHWTRVIHVAEGCLDDNVFGAPVLENVWNLLQDLLKVTGGGAEAYWLRANQGLHLDIDKDMDLGAANGTLDKLKEDLEKYKHGLTRWIRTRGVNVDVLGSDVANFSPSADAIIKQIAGSKGIPLRILTGSEQGQLASGQDASNWDTQVQDRRTSYAGPSIVRRFIDRLIEFGYLPTPVSYEIGWPVEEEMTEVEKADLAVKLAQSNATNGDLLWTDSEIREKAYDMQPLTDEQRKEITDRKTEAMKQQQEIMGPAQLAPGVAKPASDESKSQSRQEQFQRAAEAFVPQEGDEELVRVLAEAIEAGNDEVVKQIVGLA